MHQRNLPENAEGHYFVSRHLVGQLARQDAVRNQSRSAQANRRQNALKTRSKTLHRPACQKTAAITPKLTVQGRYKICNQVICAWEIIVTWAFTLSNPEEALSGGALAAPWGLRPAPNRRFWRFRAEKSTSWARAVIARVFELAYSSMGANSSSRKARRSHERNKAASEDAKPSEAQRSLPIKAGTLSKSHGQARC